MPAPTRHPRGTVAAAAAALMAFALLAGVSPARASCTHPRAATPAYRRQALQVAARLGAPADYPRRRHWMLQPQAQALAPAGRDVYGRPLRLAPAAASALKAMVAAAARDGVSLQVVSGFRSFATQRRLLRRKLDRGRPLAAVLAVNALPGFSEHHSGCALDLTTPGVPAADAAFAGTRAYAWLAAHAGHYGFALSYPEGNPHGIEFEPWHWRYRGVARPPRDEAPVARVASAAVRTDPASIAFSTTEHP
jgi:D-alanyl-D-alanine carboxypeptidase